LGIHLKEGTLVIPYSGTAAGKIHAHLPQQEKNMDYFVGMWRHREKYQGPLLVIHLNSDHALVEKYVNSEMLARYRAKKQDILRRLPTEQKQEYLSRRLDNQHASRKRYMSILLGDLAYTLKQVENCKPAQEKDGETFQSSIGKNGDTESIQPAEDVTAAPDPRVQELVWALFPERHPREKTLALKTILE